MVFEPQVNKLECIWVRHDKFGNLRFGEMRAISVIGIDARVSAWGSDGGVERTCFGCLGELTS